MRNGKTGLCTLEEVSAGCVSAKPHQLVPSLLPLAFWVRPWQVSGCFHLSWTLAFLLLETKAKGWRARAHLGHFPTGFLARQGHAAKVHHFTWSFCLPVHPWQHHGTSTLPQDQSASHIGHTLADLPSEVYGPKLSGSPCSSTPVW